MGRLLGAEAEAAAVSAVSERIRTITVTAYQRPQYLAEALVAIKRCLSVSTSGAGYKVAVYCDRSSRTSECVDLVQQHGFTPFTFEKRVGVDEAIRVALEWAWAAQSDFNIHVEDDVVLSLDALLWFEWACEAFRASPEVFTVGAYNREPSGALDGCETRPWFHPWGWATWPDRWPGMRWTVNNPQGSSWDVQVNQSRGERLEAYPCVSRAQNIGAEGGLNVRSSQWHHIHHHARRTAGDALVREFRIQR